MILLVTTPIRSSFILIMSDWKEEGPDSVFERQVISGPSPEVVCDFHNK